VGDCALILDELSRMEKEEQSMRAGLEELTRTCGQEKTRIADILEARDIATRIERCRSFAPAVAAKIEEKRGGILLTAEKGVQAVSVLSALAWIASIRLTAQPGLIIAISLGAIASYFISSSLFRKHINPAVMTGLMKQQLGKRIAAGEEEIKARQGKLKEFSERKKQKKCEMERIAAGGIQKAGQGDRIMDDDDFVVLDGVRLEKKVRHPGDIVGDLMGKLPGKK
jgi:hypothetical protein